MFVQPIKIDENRLLEAWRTHGHPKALADLIALYMPRIKTWARQGRDHREDLIGEGVIALIEACNRQEAGGVNTLNAVVRGAILRARTSITAQLTIPERQIRDALAGRMAPEKAQTIRQALIQEAFDEFSSDVTSPTTEEYALNKERNLLQRKALARAMRELDRSERYLVLQPLLRGERKIDEVATSLGMSLHRARSLQTRALNKMRNNLILNGFCMEDFQ